MSSMLRRLLQNKRFETGRGTQHLAQHITRKRAGYDIISYVGYSIVECCFDRVFAGRTFREIPLFILFMQRGGQQIVKKKRELSTWPPRRGSTATQLVTTRIPPSSLTTPTATNGSLFYAASATEDASPPLLRCPHATTRTSSKGVTVGSPYHGGADSTGVSYKTVRSSGVGSRHAVKGEEAVLLGRLLDAFEVV